MDICRICLAKSPKKDISQSKMFKKGGHERISEIVLFCLDIKIAEDLKVGLKLCLKCYKKILNFHKFKSLAQKNDAYLQSLHSGVQTKHEVYVNDEQSLESLNDQDLIIKIKDEPLLDPETSTLVDSQQGCESDDEFLSVIKRIKNEFVPGDAKENEPLKKKRGRKKVIKDPTDEKKREVCEECGKAVRNLKEHMNRHLPLEDRKKLKCKGCDREFATYGARYRHFRVKHLGIKQHCDICNKDVIDIKVHHLKIHNTSALPFGCVPCGRRFISRSALEVHMTSHTKDRPYSCDLCDKKFRVKVTLLQHKRQVHDKEKSHLCQFCPKSFFKKYHLQVHLRSHTKEKPYKCTECGGTFSSSSGLKTHRLVHSDVKAFQCSYCDSTFVKMGYLRNHLISHTKEKRHACKFCGVRFGRSDHRKRHEFTAHENPLRNWLRQNATTINRTGLSLDAQAQGGYPPHGERGNLHVSTQ